MVFKFKRIVIEMFLYFSSYFLIREKEIMVLLCECILLKIIVFMFGREKMGNNIFFRVRVILFIFLCFVSFKESIGYRYLFINVCWVEFDVLRCFLLFLEKVGLKFF